MVGSSQVLGRGHVLESGLSLEVASQGRVGSGVGVGSRGRGSRLALEVRIGSRGWVLFEFGSQGWVPHTRGLV